MNPGSGNQSSSLGLSQGHQDKAPAEASEEVAEAAAKAEMEVAGSEDTVSDTNAL